MSDPLPSLDSLAEGRRFSELDAVQRRVLWLSTYMIHLANKNPRPSGLKVGGHQASSASCVSLMTALWFAVLGPRDRVAIKPHASPVLYAIQYLLGRLEKEDLTRLRAFGGLQSYPSQTRNPDFVDFSTGSVGLGAVAVNFHGLTRSYLRGRDGSIVPGASLWAIVGDAELDEGSVWEAIAEALLDEVPGIRWIVDLNRQSLDRVVPGIRARRIERMFEANGWRVIEVKYGASLQRLFSEPGGDVLRRRIEEMPNEEYQALISGPADGVRSALLEPLNRTDRQRVSHVVDHVSDSNIQRDLAALGGHDLEALVSACREADSDQTPAVVVAYTVKGWGLPFAGDPMNHSALLPPDALRDLAETLGVPADPLARLEVGEAGADLVAATSKRLARQPQRVDTIPFVPDRIDTRQQSPSSTQEAFGRILVHLDRMVPELSERIVTVSPDVAISTNLGGWINRVGVWHSVPGVSQIDGPLRWSTGPSGRHLELGISEMNLFGLLGQLGLAGKTLHHRLIPIGTVYDVFVKRGLDALVYGLYCGSSFIVVGTPSGVALAPEGGAHQSMLTSSIGLELPNLVTYEPCFADEVEWTLLEGIRRAAQGLGSTYLRLSTLPIDSQAVDSWPAAASEGRRRGVLRGAYRIIDPTLDMGYDPLYSVLIAASGVTVPNALEAAETLRLEGVHATVINVTSADLLYQRWHAAGGRSVFEAAPLSPVLPEALRLSDWGVPIVTVVDGHPHSLAFLGSAVGSQSLALGTTAFGESGTVHDLQVRFGIDAGSITNAGLALVDRRTA